MAMQMRASLRGSKEIEGLGYEDRILRKLMKPNKNTGLIANIRKI